MSLTRRSIRAGLWALLQNGGRQVISTVVFLILARYFLSQHDFGLVAMANLVIAFLTVLVRQGLTTATIQKKDLSPDHIDSAFWATVCMGIVMTLIALAGADVVERMFGQPGLAPVVRVMSLSLLAVSLSLTQESLLSRDLSFHSLAVRTLVAAITGGTVGLAVAKLGGGVWALVALNVTTSWVAAVLIWQVSSWRPRLHFSWLCLRELMRMSLGVTGMGLVGYFNQFSDQLFVGMLLGSSLLGVYYVANRLVQMLLLVMTNSVVAVALPSFSHVQTDHIRLRRGFQRAISVTSLVGFPVFAFLTIAAPEVVSVVFGGRWLAAVPVMQWLAMSALVYTVQNFNSGVLLALGRAGLALRMSLLATLLLGALCGLGVHYGIEGVAIAACLKPLIMLPLWLVVLRREISLPPSLYVRTLAVPTLGCVALALAYVLCRMVIEYAMHGPSWAVLGVGVLVGGTAYILVASLWGRETVRFMLEPFAKKVTGTP